MTELELVYSKLQSAECPEDVFGMAVPVNRTFRELRKAVHPDHNQDNPKLAEQAFVLLTDIHKQAVSAIGCSVYGKNVRLPWKVESRINSYAVRKFPENGDVCDLWLDQKKNVLVKIARNLDDNDLLLREAESLKTLESILPPVREGIPKLVKQFKVCVSGKWKHCANVIEYFPDFVTLKEAKRRLGEIPSRHLVWIFKRLLKVLGWSHHLGIIHGAVLPQHVLVFPDNTVVGRDYRKHSVRLIDWCYSVPTTRTRLTAVVEGYEDFYAPEIFLRDINITCDIYSAAKTILSLGRMPERFKKILTKTIDKNPKMRYPNCKSIFDEWTKASIDEYGKPTWVDFNL